TGIRGKLVGLDMELLFRLRLAQIPEYGPELMQRQHPLAVWRQCHGAGKPVEYVQLYRNRCSLAGGHVENDNRFGSSRVKCGGRKQRPWTLWRSHEACGSRTEHRKSPSLCGIAVGLRPGDRPAIARDGQRLSR